MKKAIAMVLIVVMMLALGASAFAAGGPLTLEQAKQAALKYAGVKAADATFTKGHKDWDNGRQVYEIEFYANNTEYDMDVDVYSGRLMDFSTEYHGRQTYSEHCFWDDDFDDMFDLDHDLDDLWDFD